MNLNDWKTIQIRNDIKEIKRILDQKALFDITLIVDISLVTFGVFLDKAIGVCGSNKIILWGILALLSIATPFTIHLCRNHKIKKDKQLDKKIKNAKKLIDIFDNEITYLIMSAEQFNNSLREDFKTVKDKQEALLFKFYYIETAYYLDKAVRLFWAFDNNLSVVIKMKNSGISISRLENAIALLASIYRTTLLCVKRNKSKLERFNVFIDCSEIETAYTSLGTFVKYRKDVFGREIVALFN